MDYQVFSPTDPLSSLIKCYWTLEAPQPDKPVKETIVPDGCMEMIFHHGDLYRQYLDEEKSIIQPRCFVFGQLSQPLEIEATGATGIFSVRFYPYGFIPFSTLPMAEMEDKATDLTVLFGDEGKDLGEEVVKTQKVDDKIKLVEKFLISRLTSPEVIDQIVASAVETLLTLKGNMGINDLSDQLNISRKQLERKFSSKIGIKPKQLARIIRMQTCLNLLLKNDYESLTALAYEGAYYDQAHFIKDFKSFTGMSPKNFYGDHLKMSSLFYSKE